MSNSHKYYPYVLKFEKFLPVYNIWFADTLGFVTPDDCARWCAGVEKNGIEIRNLEWFSNPNYREAV